MAYSNEFITKVMTASDIVSVVEQYIPLKRAGGNYTALCPFHQEKTPSFHVSKQKQIFKCFGCGQGGNVFSFVMKMDHVPFPEAVRQLAEKAGIEIPETRVSPLEKRKQYLFDVMKSVTGFYSAKLMKNKKAVEYLNSRGIGKDMIDEFSIGYSPDERSLLEFASVRGYSNGDLEKLGLVVPRGGRPVDKFRNRVLFPILDIRGRTVAFGGRTLEDSNIKYLNSPETVLYHKSDVLFSLNRAKREIIKEKSVIVTEGYMDVLALYQFGFKNVVGVLGTAFTDQHVYHLRRFADRVYLLFDSDQAGIMAVERSAEKILASELQGFVVRLNNAKDADELLRRSGRKALAERIIHAYPLMEFLRKLYHSRHSGKSPDWKARVVKDIIPFLEKISNAVTKEEEIKKTALMLDISVPALQEEMLKKDGKKYIRKEAEEPGVKMPKKHIFEREIVSFLINNPETIDMFRESIKLDDFSYMGKFLSKIYDIFDKEEEISVSKFISCFPERDDAEYINSIAESSIGGAGDALDKEKLHKCKKRAESLIRDFENIVGMEQFRKWQRICRENPTVENMAEFMKYRKYSGKRGGYS